MKSTSVLQAHSASLQDHTRCAALLWLSLVLTALSNLGIPLPWLVWVALAPLLIDIERCSRNRQTLVFGLW